MRFSIPHSSLRLPHQPLEKQAGLSLAICRKWIYNKSGNTLFCSFQGREHTQTPHHFNTLKRKFHSFLKVTQSTVSRMSPSSISQAIRKQQHWQGNVLFHFIARLYVASGCDFQMVLQVTLLRSWKHSKIKIIAESQLKPSHLFPKHRASGYLPYRNIKQFFYSSTISTH